MTPFRLDRIDQDRSGSKKLAEISGRTVDGMSVVVSTMFIPVHDPDEALAFYCGPLGLEVRNDAVFSAQDLDETFERIRSSDTAEVLQEPKSQPWGVRDCAFRDPSGNLVRIAQLPEEQP